jgi:hypothetical protein
MCSLRYSRDMPASPDPLGRHTWYQIGWLANMPFVSSLYKGPDKLVGICLRVPPISRDPASPSDRPVSELAEAYKCRNIENPGRRLITLPA